MNEPILQDSPSLRLVPFPMPQHLHDATMQPLEASLAKTRLQIAYDDPPVFVDRPAESFASDVKYAARVAVNMLDPERLQDAQLRARDQLAYAVYGADYTRQPQNVQSRINHVVQTVWDALRVHLQGISEPLSPSQRLALTPERRQKTEVGS